MTQQCLRFVVFVGNGKQHIIMEKPKHIDMQTPDGAQLNLDALYKIAPSCFTEAKGEDGEMRHVVDFNKLR